MRRCFVLLAIPLMACTDHTPRAGTAIVRDSAGVRIVGNTSPLWQDGQEWHVGEEPVVDIGGGEAEENQLFRVQGAVRLGNGTIVVANLGSFELRYYDSTGRFVGIGGGEGEGPGEFGRGPWEMWKRSGDTIAATDLGNFRLSYFDHRGGFARAVTLRPEPGMFPRIIGQLDDGRLVTWDAIIRQYRGPEGTTFRDSSLYQTVSSDGARFEDVAQLPAAERWTYTWLGRTNEQALPFGRIGRSVVSNDGFYYTSADHFEILKFTPSMGLVSMVRVLAQPRALTSEAISNYKAERMANAPDDPTGRQAWRRWLDDAPYPPTFPTFHDLLVDEEQNLWAGLFELPVNILPANFTLEWMVFRPDGRLYGTVVMPQRFTPHDIGLDYVLGLWRDELDVEHVRLYDLIKPEQ